MNKKLLLSTSEILDYQQNRYPLLFIDVIEIDTMVTARSKKNFTYNEWFFPSHFEDDPNVPGFVLLENLAQTFIMTFLSDETYKGRATAFLRADKVVFKRMIRPGDSIETIATLDQFSRGVATGSASSYMLLPGDAKRELVASAELCIALPDVLLGAVPKKEIRVEF